MRLRKYRVGMTSIESRYRGPIASRKARVYRSGRPDIVIFIPVDDVAMVESVKALNETNIPVVLASNPLPGRFVTYVGADDFEIGYRQARYLFDTLRGAGRAVAARAIR